MLSGSLLPPPPNPWRRVVLLNTELQRTRKLEEMRAQGLVWIRRSTGRSFDSLLRIPTIGCHVELLTVKGLFCVHIDSDAGKRLIRRLCYF